MNEKKLIEALKNSGVNDNLIIALDTKAKQYNFSFSKMLTLILKKELEDSIPESPEEIEKKKLEAIEKDCQTSSARNRRKNKPGIYGKDEGINTINNFFE